MRVTDGLFKLNVMTMINKSTSSVYLLESSYLCHGILGHVNYDSIRLLINLDHIPTFQVDSKHKSKICVEEKSVRTTVHKIERSTKPLELIKVIFVI